MWKIRFITKLLTFIVTQRCLIHYLDLEQFTVKYWCNQLFPKTNDVRSAVWQLAAFKVLSLVVEIFDPRNISP